MKLDMGLCASGTHSPEPCPYCWWTWNHICILAVHNHSKLQSWNPGWWRDSHRFWTSPTREQFHDLSVGSSGNMCKPDRELRKSLLIYAGVAFAIPVSSSTSQREHPKAWPSLLCNSLLYPEISCPRSLSALLFWTLEDRQAAWDGGAQPPWGRGYIW